MKRLIFILTFAFCLLSFALRQSLAAVGSDIVSSGSGDTVSFISWSHTITGTNTALLCSCAATSGDTNCGNITFDGNILAERANINTGGAGYNLKMSGGAVSGSHTVQVNVSSLGAIVGGCESFTGVNQASPFGTPVTDSDNSISASITIPASGMGWDSVISSDQCSGFTAGAGQSKQFDVCSPDGFTTSAGSIIAASATITYDNTNSSYQLMIAVPINQAVAASVIRRGPIIQ